MYSHASDNFQNYTTCLHVPAGIAHRVVYNYRMMFHLFRHRWIHWAPPQREIAIGDQAAKVSRSAHPCDGRTGRSGARFGSRLCAGGTGADVARSGRRSPRYQARFGAWPDAEGTGASGARSGRGSCLRDGCSFHISRKCRGRPVIFRRTSVARQGQRKQVSWWDGFRRRRDRVSGRREHLLQARSCAGGAVRGRSRAGHMYKQARECTQAAKFCALPFCEQHCRWREFSGPS